MRIYSGECEHGECGGQTDLVDEAGHVLYVGDIVCLAHSKDGFFCFHGLSAVVEDRPELVGAKQDRGPFIMGLRNADLSTDGPWRIMRVKSFSDVIDGEHWKNYGFSYKA